MNVLKMFMQSFKVNVYKMFMHSPHKAMAQKQDLHMCSHAAVITPCWCLYTVREPNNVKNMQHCTSNSKNEGEIKCSRISSIIKTIIQGLMAFDKTNIHR